MKRLLIGLLLLLMVTPVLAQVDDPTPDINPPLYATDETFALVWVNRANLRSAPSVTDGAVIDIALSGQRFPITGVYFPGESTVVVPQSDPREFVYDDPGESEVWYLIDTGAGEAWIFGGVVLVSNPDGLPIGDRTLTPAQQASIDRQVAEANATIGVRGTLNVRSGPGIGYSVLNVVPQDERVTLVGRNAYATWFLVDYDGTRGWIAAPFAALPQGLLLDDVPVARQR